jgi:hypothetical protein
MPFPRMTWAGLLIATLGWGLLLAYPLLASHGPVSPGAHEIRDPARFILIFGENAVVTGLAIALLGAMEKVIALLGRSAATAGQSKAGPQASAPRAPSLGPSPQLLSARQTNEIVTKGALAGRDYVLFRDGSVVVETLLGPRRFLSMTEAQEFIGAN